MKKYAFAGASQRALWMYCKPMLESYQDVAVPCGVYDINFGRSQSFVKESGGNFKAYEDFDEMLRVEKPDCVIVTTADAYHAEYIVRALEAGCDAITEKPMTINEVMCRDILEAEKRTGRKVTVTFNYRYSPVNTKIKELLSQGLLGEIYSVHFEWLLTRNMALDGHGASYFRRWNSRMEKSGGLLVHKATHHFDLINWWIDQKPAKVSAFGQLRLFGGKNYPFGEKVMPGQRCSNCSYIDKCDFYWEIDDFDKRYYQSNEKHDGYIKDNCVYAEDIDIYDTMGVTVQYDKGAIMTYSLNATTPYDGHHIVINGSLGRLEMRLYSTGFEAEKQVHIRFYDLNNNVTDYAITKATGGHGGGDEKIRQMLFRGNTADPLGHAAGAMAGAYSILIGAAANNSIATGQVVDIEELLNG